MKKTYELNELSYKLIAICATIDSALTQTVIASDLKKQLHIFFLVVIIICAITNIIVKKYELKEFLFICLVLIFGIYSYKVSTNTDLFLTLVSVMLIVNVNIDEVLIIIYRIRTLFFVGTIMASIFGLLPIGELVSESGEKGVLFGYSHANTFAGTAGIIILLMITVNRNKLRKRHIIIAAIIELLVYYFSRARISIVLIALMIALIMLCNKQLCRDKFLKLEGIFFPGIMVLSFGLIGIKILGVAKNVTGIADYLTNGRITLAAMHLLTYPITLLGQNIDISIVASQNSYYALDNGYVYILLHYGVIGLFIFGLLFQMSMLNVRKNNDYILGIVGLVFMIWSTYEGMMISAAANFMLLFAVAKIDVTEYRNRSRKR